MVKRNDNEKHFSASVYGAALVSLFKYFRADLQRRNLKFSGRNDSPEALLVRLGARTEFPMISSC